MQPLHNSEEMNSQLPSSIVAAGSQLLAIGYVQPAESAKGPQGRFAASGLPKASRRVCTFSRTLGQNKLKSPTCQFSR